MTLHRRFIHALIVALMLLGLGASGLRPAAAQVSGDSYADPEYDWEVSWDGEIWTVVENPKYTLVLRNEGDSYLFFENRDDGGDVQECVDGRVDEVTAEDGVDNVKPLEDAGGDPIGTSSNDRVTAAYSLTYTNPNAANARSVDRVNAFDCRVLLPGEAVLAITFVTSANAYEDDVDLVDDLLAGLAIPAVAGADQESTATPADEATSTPDREVSTATPTEESTATPEEDEPTGTPDEENVSDEAPDPAEGIDGNTYTSPTYGYSVEWDEDVWTPNTSANRVPGRDTLVLDVTSSGYVYFEAYDEYAGDPADCLDGSSAEIIDDRDVNNVEPYEDENGDVVEGAEDGVAFAAYTFSFGEDDAVGYFECRTLVEGEAVLAVSLVTLAEDFGDVRAELSDLLDTLDLGEATSTPTPEDDETATPDADDETPTPERGADSIGVNGNSYTSPTYGYTLEWDEDLWEVDAERTASGTRDVLVLDYTDGGSLYVEGYGAYDGDPDDCLDGSSTEILELDSVDNVAPLEDENRDPIAGEEDGVVFAAYSLDIGGTAAVAYFSCQTLVEGEAVLAFSLIVPEDVAEDGMSDLADAQSSLELAESSGRGGTRTPTPDNEETPTPRGGDNGAGVNGNAYESPTYGFAVEWDEDVWAVDDTSSEDGVDLLVLTDAGSTVTFEAMEGFDGDAEACVAAAEDEIASRRGVQDVEILEDEDGPLVEGDEDYAYTYYGYTLEQRNGDSEDLYEYVECKALEEGASVLRISQVAAIADATEELDALDELLNGVELASTGPAIVRSSPGIAA